MKRPEEMTVSFLGQSFEQVLKKQSKKGQKNMNPKKIITVSSAQKNQFFSELGLLQVALTPWPWP